MAGLQLSGLASNFDWKSVVDQLMTIEHAPADRLEVEKSRNSDKAAALAGLDTKLTALQGAANALKSAGLFASRDTTLTTTGSTWSANAASNTAPGTYAFNVTQLATTARRTGASDIAAGLATTADVSGLTLATLPTASAVTAGTFSVNGEKVTVALTDSLASVFQAISDATNGEVTAAYDPVTDKVALTGATGPVTVGAANDTSNFLRVFRLGNNGTDTIQSAAALGTMKTGSPLASAGLRTAVSSPTGSFKINGVSISYDTATDSLNTILSRITASTAGVTATYDAAADRVVLTNKTTGDTGLAVSEAAGGLLAALGVSPSSGFTRGRNAEFTLNSGATLSSASNTLDASAHGITGLAVTVNTEGSQTVQVAADTTAMRSAIDTFISKFNDVQAYIDSKTQITSTNGKVSTAVLADNLEIQSWQRNLRSLAFNAVPGLGGTINRLENLGIDFGSSGAALSVKDSDKLSAALRDHADDVAKFFQTASTGFAAKFDQLVTKLTDKSDAQQTRLQKASDSLDQQIADIERRIVQQRELLTNSFVAMESAQARIQQQGAAITRAFSNNSSSG
jgi:flagellar hook-associated protein 2